MQDSYYSRKEVSNSDLSALKNQLHPIDMPDPTQAYRFGNLIDAMITEQHRVNYFKRTCDDNVFSKEDFEIALEMKKVFYADETCKLISTGSDTQKVMSAVRTDFNYKGINFSMPVRCKWDLWQPSWKWGGDIKSTTATTQEQFEAAIRYFDYDRQRAWYMDIAKSNKDLLIGISKKNFKIFKVFIKRGDDLYNSGLQKYSYLAFMYKQLNQAA